MQTRLLTYKNLFFDKTELVKLFNGFKDASSAYIETTSQVPALSHRIGVLPKVPLLNLPVKRGIYCDCTYRNVPEWLPNKRAILRIMVYAAVAQLVEHRIRNAGVASSNLVSSTTLLPYAAMLLGGY